MKYSLFFSITLIAVSGCSPGMFSERAFHNSQYISTEQGQEVPEHITRFLRSNYDVMINFRSSNFIGKFDLDSSHVCITDFLDRVKDKKDVSFNDAWFVPRYPGDLCNKVNIPPGSICKLSVESLNLYDSIYMPNVFHMEVDDKLNIDTGTSFRWLPDPENENGLIVEIEVDDFVSPVGTNKYVFWTEDDGYFQIDSAIVKSWPDKAYISINFMKMSKKMVQTKDNVWIKIMASTSYTNIFSYNMSCKPE